MKVVFITNYYNHHQKPLADAMFSIIGDDYYLIETAAISDERLQMGWGGEEKPAYVLQNYTDEHAKIYCQQIIDTADIAIIGSAPGEMIRKRLKKGLVTFFYTERVYKKGTPYIKIPIHFFRSLSRYIRYKNFYMLCASAYAPLDFSKTFAFIGKTYKWGYFPETKSYSNIDQLIEMKCHSSILWVARFIEWKHPEVPVLIAKRLKDENYSFEMNLIGTGVLEEKIQNMIHELGLSDCVHMLGAMKPEQVREHMENSQIFLFTSDRNEGWGAVLNEAMNSACAVVASHAIGAAPFLIKDGENGLIYEDGCIEDLYEKVKMLLDNREERNRIGAKAYETLINEWNAENAAKKFLQLVHRILAGNEAVDCFADGVCSRAKILKDDWYNKSK